VAEEILSRGTGGPSTMCFFVNSTEAFEKLIEEGVFFVDN
jgi:hypothetical protein